MSVGGAKWLGSLFADVMKPKVAAGAAAGGSLFAADDSDAAVTLRLLQEGPTVYNKLRKQLARGRGGPRSTLSIAEDVLHDKSLANYDHFSGYARKADGGMSGDVYKSGVQGLYDEILGSVDEPDREVVAALDEWLGKRLGREYGVSMKDNRAIDLQKRRAAAGAGAGATAAAGAASASESPEMGWREWPTQEQQVPTSPAERGFAPWSDYEPQPSYLDRVTDPSTYANALMPYFEAGSWLANTPVGKYVGDRVGEAMDHSEMPGRFIQGAGRAGYGVLNGESLPEAFSAGRDTFGNTLAENGEAFEQWGVDQGWHPEDAAAAGTFAEYGLDPLTYAGFGLLGKVGKAF